MILGNGSEDPDPDLNEPDPIGVVRDDLSRAAILVSLVPLFIDMGQIQCMVRELNVFSQKVNLKWILLLGMGRIWIILFLVEE